MEKNMELSSLIHGKFRSESQCAERLGWPRQRLSKITNGAREPNVSEVGALADVLGINVGDMANIFLHRQSPIGD